MYVEYTATYNKLVYYTIPCVLYLLISIYVVWCVIDPVYVADILHLGKVYARRVGRGHLTGVCTWEVCKYTYVTYLYTSVQFMGYEHVQYVQYV